MAAWFGFLNVHARLTRELDNRLVQAHGMPLVEYEVLLKLSIAGGAMRMSDLAEAALLSRSGLTRIVDELESLGLVTRAPDDTDGRVFIATMTAAGRRRFLAARRTHLAGVKSLFLDALRPGQAPELAAAWRAIEERLPPPETARRRRGPVVRERVPPARSAPSSATMHDDADGRRTRR